jgi:hypothetical protein
MIALIGPRSLSLPEEMAGDDQAAFRQKMLHAKPAT